MTGVTAQPVIYCAKGQSMPCLKPSSPQTTEAISLDQKLIFSNSCIGKKLETKLISCAENFQIIYVGLSHVQEARFNFLLFKSAVHSNKFLENNTHRREGKTSSQVKKSNKSEKHLQSNALFH